MRHTTEKITLENIRLYFVEVTVKTKGVEVPYWQCRRCGYLLHESTLPQIHVCPLDGKMQAKYR